MSIRWNRHRHRASERTLFWFDLVWVSSALVVVLLLLFRFRRRKSLVIARAVNDLRLTQLSRVRCVRVLRIRIQVLWQIIFNFIYLCAIILSSIRLTRIVYSVSCATRCQMVFEGIIGKMLRWLCWISFFIYFASLASSFLFFDFVSVIRRDLSVREILAFSSHRLCVSTYHLSTHMDVPTELLLHTFTCN